MKGEKGESEGTGSRRAYLGRGDAVSAFADLKAECDTAGQDCGSVS
jgi:hypothetical protein